MSTPNSVVGKKKKGVVLMTYGSATTTEHVRDYFEKIYGGKVSEATIQEFEKRYNAVGRSPLIDITHEQAALLEGVLGEGYVVRAGMRHLEPSIASAVAECRESGAESLTSIILAPQFSSLILEGYRTAFMQAASDHGFKSDAVHMVGTWNTEPHFIELVAERVKTSLAALAPQYHRAIPIIFTTHSLPKRVVDQDPGYLDQLTATIDAVRSHLASDIEWYAGYQSAGHTPEEWLKPDLTELLDEVKERGAPAVLIAPIQFVSDHLEVLYDLDIAARAQCEERGIAYHRINLPNTDPLFIKALTTLAH